MAAIQRDGRPRIAAAPLVVGHTIAGKAPTVERNNKAQPLADSPRSDPEVPLIYKWKLENVVK